MKNESNTGNSPSAIRKSRTFALAAALLSTLVFASAAHACIMTPTNNGGWALTCVQTNDSGYVYLAVNGIWQQQAYYHVTDAQWMHIYYYGPKVWTIQDRSTLEMWVANAAGGWTPYTTYQAQALTLLKTLAALSQSQTSSTPTIQIVPASFVNDTCSAIRAMQLRYAQWGLPPMTYSFCGQ
jgi:hypothetical protein